jgi:hypothetical protein
MTRHRSWPRGRGSSWVSNYSSKIMNRWKFPNWAISGDRVLWGMLQVLGQFGAVPRKVVWDQEGCIGRWWRGRQVFTAEFQAFRGMLGRGAVLCGPADPEFKRQVEQGNGYLGDQLPAGPPVRGCRRFQPSAPGLAETG